METNKIKLLERIQRDEKKITRERKNHRRSNSMKEGKGNNRGLRETIDFLEILAYLRDKNLSNILINNDYFTFPLARLIFR